MCFKVLLFVPMLLCNWAVIWMPLFIFPYVLSLVSQMQLDPHVNPIPTTDYLSVCLAICLLTCPLRFPQQTWWQLTHTHTADLMHLWTLHINSRWHRNTGKRPHRDWVCRSKLTLLSERRHAPPLWSYSGSSQAVMMLTMVTQQDRLLVLILLIPLSSLTPSVFLSFLVFVYLCFFSVTLFLENQCFMSSTYYSSLYAQICLQFSLYSEEIFVYQGFYLFIYFLT